MEELPVQTHIYRLDPTVFDDFVESLDAPRELPKLEKLFTKPSIFTDCE